MYARDVDGKTLTLGVSGMLWEGNLIMVDQETQSLWSQMLGTAMRGPLVGTELENIPAQMTNWTTWKQKHPDTTVFIMPRTSRLFTRDFLGPNRGVGIGLVLEGEARFWDYGRLNSHPVVNDQLGRTQLLAVIDKLSLTPAIYSRELGGRELHFRLDEGELVDIETKSTWDLLTGEAVDGELAGQHLDRMAGFTSDAAAWSLYFPTTTWWVPTSEPARAVE